MLENLQSVNVFSPNLSEIISNIIISLICSFIVSVIYRYTYKGPGYSESFVHSIVFLSAITALVIMVIGNNLARAFGLVGALSIIRFRTAIKDTIDIVYIFLGLAIGMAAGVGYHKAAIAGTIIIGLILIIFTKSNFRYFRSNQYILQFNYSNGNSSGEEFSGTLSKYCINFEIINIRTNPDNTIDYTFYLRIRKSLDSKFIIDDLQKVNGVQKLNLYFDQQNS
ncbi:MAG: hypothetical protein A2057_02340 [Ignavibacteria bacterium GWA2_35_9]|nr:MAG: hypothetical protein A2057_02340 [Ignavibacteria bacterium GWA2_35_9]OGU48554.1 MAG: hypothetical protein A2000_14050 [Ignavibacteria bacterium GWB2_36_8]OGU49756.1 MAG: hypothetical protein A2080_10665 [Ignavibacteria bacterium GWC2_36_12]